VNEAREVDAATLRSAARRGIVTVLVVVVVVVLIILGLSRSELAGADIAGLLEAAEPFHLIAAIAAMSLGYWFLALRWRALLPTDAPIAVAPLAGVLVIAKLLNYAIPGPVGEVAAAMMAARRTGLPAEATFAAAVHGRVIGLVCSGLVAGLVFLFFPLPIEGWLIPWVRTAAVGAMVAALVLAVLSAQPRLIVVILDVTIGRFPRLAKVHASGLRFAEALGRIGRIGLRRYMEATMWALVAHAFVILGTAIACWGFGADPSGPGLVFTYAMATAGSVVLFTVPGSQAGWDVAFLLLLVSAAGLPKATAAAVTLIVQLQQVVLVLIGAVALLRMRGDGSGSERG
jgi:uncharacterized membrane protein YbhN (UPF0104 family)